VIALAPAAAAISNMYVTMSAAPGHREYRDLSTYRDAGSSTALTCVVSGASATTCNDTTHNFHAHCWGCVEYPDCDQLGRWVVTPNIKIYLWWNTEWLVAGVEVVHR